MVTRQGWLLGRGLLGMHLAEGWFFVMNEWYVFSWMQ